MIAQLYRRSPGQRIASASAAEQLLRQCLVHWEQPQRQRLPRQLRWPMVRPGRGWWIPAGAILALTLLAFQLGMMSVTTSEEKNVDVHQVQPASASPGPFEPR